MTPLLAAPRLRRDPEASFETVYRKHVRDVYGFALSIVGNAQDAEDVAQTTFLNAYRALNSGERVQNVRAWLLAIAHNVCRQRFRTAARRPQEVELDPEAAEAFSDDEAPTAHDLRAAMAQLAFNQRAVLVLREIEGLSYEEIAQAMGLSLSAVETLLFRARQALREQLEVAEKDLGCDSVQRLISLQLDGKLSRPDRRLLRAHLRSCAECARFARSQRARKRVMPGIVAVPLPASLAGAFQSGGAGFLTAKAAALAVSAAIVGTGTLVGSGVVPVPGNSNSDVRQAAIRAAASDSAASGASARASLELRDEVGLASGGTQRAVKARGAQAGKNQAGTKQAGKKQRAGGSKGGAIQAAAGGSVQASGGGGAGSGGGSGGSGGSGGGGGGGGSAEASGGGGVTSSVTQGAQTTTQGVQSTVADPVDSVDSVVQGVQGTVQQVQQQAEDKVPPLPVSPQVQLPSLPPVPLPGTGSLP